MRAYYNKFERHSQGEGLKGHATHYCPGCGHGLVHNYLSEAIENLAIKDRTIAISPVGCSVFLYYYLDVGNSQAAHGRAPAVALGHKIANPNSIVISYQGDGDLASIGLAEIIHTAQLGVPLTVIFVNNAIYGMTGGQMAPTTLMEQKTQTSPHGRTKMNGEPMKIAEMIAGLDGPIYVERVALYNAAQRNKCKRAIQKALKLQVENKGLSFIEVLSECPTHWKCTPLEAEKWVQEKMLPIFPLGVKKDLTQKEPTQKNLPQQEELTSWFQLKAPIFEAQKMAEVLHVSNEKIPSFSKAFPSHLDSADISLKFAGSGGDGAQTVAMLVAQAAVNENYDSTHIPSYGPESRGGTSYADVHVAKERVFSPASPQPHILLAFNAPSLNKFGPLVQEGGFVIYDSSIVLETPQFQKGVQAFGVPFTQMAAALGKVLVKNIVALGALQAVTQLFPEETLLTALREALGNKTALIPLNESAFKAGTEYIKKSFEKRG